MLLSWAGDWHALHQADTGVDCCHVSLVQWGAPCVVFSNATGMAGGMETGPLMALQAPAYTGAGEARACLRGPVVAAVGVNGNAQARAELAEVRVRHYVREHPAPLVHLDMEITVHVNRVLRRLSSVCNFVWPHGAQGGATCNKQPLTAVFPSKLPGKTAFHRGALSLLNY